MNKEERFIYARDVLGWTANEQGDVFNAKGRKIGSKNSGGYLEVCIYVNRKNYHILLHQFIYWYFKNEFAEQIDHIDGNRQNNSIYNIRAVSHQQNQWNKKNTNGYSQHKNGKYRASIKLDSKTIHLGYYSDKEEAKLAYLSAKEKYHVFSDKNN